MKPAAQVYGAVPDGARQRRRDAGEEPMGVLRVRDLLAIFGIGAILTALGFWQVGTVFAIRDYEMGTGELMQRTVATRDKSREMAVRIGSLQTDESMRRVALANYGMVDPEPAFVTKLKVSPEAAERWRAAADSSRREDPGRKGSTRH